MARTSHRLPRRFPVGSKYVVENQGLVVSRYIEFPDGRRVVLAKRMARSCADAVRHCSADKIRSKKSRLCPSAGALTTAG
jgi:hypothetical protein